MQTEKRQRALKPAHLRKTKTIKFRVTEEEFKRYESAKNRLLNHSPTLHTSDILRKCSENIDDFALLEFLSLPSEHPLKVKFRLDYQFSLMEK